MSINRGTTVHKAKIYMAAIVLTLTLVVDVLFMQQLEADKRQQGRYNVEHTIACIHSHDHKASANMLDNTVLGVATWRECSNKMRTSPTGDMYILNRDTLQFLYDPSSDVPKGEPMYFTNESVGKLFTEWPTAELALIQLTSGASSTTGSNVSYNFDGDTEWLEYATYRTKCGTDIIVVQGIQSDEATARYLGIRLLVAGAVFFYTVWLLTTALPRRR